jgi:hypothetical protein
VKAVVAVEIAIVVQRRKAPTTSLPPIRSNFLKNKNPATRKSRLGFLLSGEISF